MNLAFKIATFVFLLNFSIGVVSLFFPTLAMPRTYDSDMSTAFTNQWNSSVNPEANVESQGLASFRILDLLNLGIFNKIQKLISSFLFGVTNIIVSFVPAFEPFRLLMNSMLVFIYALGIIFLFTGRDIHH